MYIKSSGTGSLSTLQRKKVKPSPTRSWVMYPSSWFSKWEYSTQFEIPSKTLVKLMVNIDK